MTAATPSDADALLAKHEQLLTASKAGDIEGLVSLFGDDAVLMAPNEPTLYGKAEVKEWFEEYFQHFSIVALTDTERETTIMNDGWAVERWAYMVAILPANSSEVERIRDDGRWFIIWKRDTDGSWKMSQVMFNSIRPVGSGTSRFFARLTQRRREK
jgi:ketosteroid isomerase-like protein